MNWIHFSRLLDWKRFRTWWIADCKWTEGNSWLCTEFGFSANTANLFWPTLAPDKMGLLGFLKKHNWCLVDIGQSKESNLNLSLEPRENYFYQDSNNHAFYLWSPLMYIFSSFSLLWDLKKSFLSFYSNLITEVFMGIGNFKSIKKLFPCGSIMYDKVPFDCMFH